VRLRCSAKHALIVSATDERCRGRDFGQFTFKDLDIVPRDGELVRAEAARAIELKEWKGRDQWTAIVSKSKRM